MKSMILSGAQGRMGRGIAAEAAQSGFEIAAGVDRKPGVTGFPLYKSLSLCNATADVLVDFSRPDALPSLCGFAVAHHMPLVLGATGYTQDDRQIIEKAAQETAIFQSSNMSMGVYVLHALAREAARMLPGWDIEIVERHHNKKIDAPSGTALSLLKVVSSQDTETVYERHTRSQARGSREIGIHSVRGGTVTGIHEIGYYGDEELITLTHSLQSRSALIAGALRASAFIIGKPAGLYGMAELVGNQ